MGWSKTEQLFLFRLSNSSVTDMMGLFLRRDDLMATVAEEPLILSSLNETAEPFQ